MLDKIAALNALHVLPDHSEPGDGSLVAQEKAFIAEVQNVTLSKEVTPFGLSCTGMQTSAGGTTQCTYSTIGPLTLPSVGAEASF